MGLRRLVNRAFDWVRGGYRFLLVALFECEAICGMVNVNVWMVEVNLEGTNARIQF